MLLIEMPWPTHRSQMCLKTKADWHIIGFERVLVEANKAGILIPWCFCCISKTSWNVRSAPFQGFWPTSVPFKRRSDLQFLWAVGPTPIVSLGGWFIGQVFMQPFQGNLTATLCGNFRNPKIFPKNRTYLKSRKLNLLWNLLRNWNPANLQKAFGKVKPTKKVIASILFHQPWCPAMAAIFKHHTHPSICCFGNALKSFISLRRVVQPLLCWQRSRNSNHKNGSLHRNLHHPQCGNLNSTKYITSKFQG